MAKRETTFHCKVVTPERVVLDTPAEFVALPAWDGEVGVLRHRAPLMVKLGIGILRVTTARGKQEMAIDGGFAEMVDNELSILTEHAHFGADLDGDEVRKALAEAQALEAHDPAAVARRNDAIARSKTQLRLVD